MGVWNSLLLLFAGLWGRPYRKECLWFRLRFWRVSAQRSRRLHLWRRNSNISLIFTLISFCWNVLLFFLPLILLSILLLCSMCLFIWSLTSVTCASTVRLLLIKLYWWMSRLSFDGNTIFFLNKQALWEASGSVREFMWNCYCVLLMYTYVLNNVTILVWVCYIHYVHCSHW